jgi:hypothetical protein
MPEYQTTVQDATAILRGSAMLELSTYVASPSYLDVGTLSGLEVMEVMEVNKEENDNADADELVTKQEMTIKANLHEAANSAVWSILRSTFDTVTTVAAAEVAGATYVFAANTTAVDTLYELPGQNDSGAVQTITTVIATGPITYVHQVDYDMVKNASKKWCIVFLSGHAGGAYNAALACTVTYTYTPSASKLTKSGDKTVLPWFIARITTKNDGNAFVTTCYKCKITKGREWKYPKDDDTDRRVKVPIEIICKPDALYNSSFVYSISQEGGL